MNLRSLLLASLLSLGALVGPGGGVAHAERDNTPKELKHVGVDEHLDGQLPLDATFRNENGAMVRLGDYFKGERPALFILAYHSCPVICGMIQHAAATAMKEVPWSVGKEYDLVVVSIDPRDTPETATKKKASIAGAYGRQGAEAGMHYLVGDKQQIDRVTTAVGFQYEYDERQQQYAHPAVVMLVKPNGQMARYLYGLEYDPKDVRLGLLEASNGRSISTIEKVILYCYHYDPQDGKYSLMATRVMQLSGFVTVLVLGSFLGVMWTRERRRKKAEDTRLPQERDAYQRRSAVTEN
ncbi:SCO family protein [Pendulispora albinea]|uniref:SCO family protein n=1 Tax=Pendulispora albinea TaxID=2741071 RepID=A0ABZ2LVQ6_9BACT